MTKTCAHCGSEFQAGRNTKKYCKEGCRTMASNKKNGFKVGRIPIGEKAKDLAVENPLQVVQQGMNGTGNGRAKDEITGAGTIESFFGSSIANLITQLITRGEYDERIAKLQRTLNYIVHLLEKIAGVRKPMPQVNKEITNHTQDLQKSGMPLLKLPNDHMM